MHYICIMLRYIYRDILGPCPRDVLQLVLDDASDSVGRVRPANTLRCSPSPSSRLGLSSRMIPAICSKSFDASVCTPSRSWAACLGDERAAWVEAAVQVLSEPPPPSLHSIIIIIIIKNGEKIGALHARVAAELVQCLLACCSADDAPPSPFFNNKE